MKTKRFFTEIPNALMLVDSLEHYTYSGRSERCDPIFYSIPDITFFFPVVGVAYVHSVY